MAVSLAFFEKNVKAGIDKCREDGYNRVTIKIQEAIPMVTLVKMLVAIIKILISLFKFGFLDEPLSKLEGYLDTNA